LQTHVKVLGVLFLVSAALYALFAIAFPLGFGIFGGLMSQSEDADAATGAAMLGLVGVGLSVLFGILALVSGICGYGVLKHRPWARIFAIVLCAMSLIKIPFGTALGIYGLWIMFHKETEALFTKSPQTT
jgi:hypothetical protein